MLDSAMIISLDKVRKGLPQNIPKLSPLLVPAFIPARRNWRGVEELGREHESKWLFHKSLEYWKVELLLIIEQKCSK